MYAPKAFEIGRYEHIWQQFPFVVETPVVPQSAGLEQRFVLTGVATLNSAPVVFVLDRRSLSRVIVTQTKNAQNIQLIAVQPNVDPQKASATIQVGTEQAVIHYDLAALQGADQASAKDNPVAPGSAQAGAASVPSTEPIKSVTTQTAAAPPIPITIIRRSQINLKH